MKVRTNSSIKLESIGVEERLRRFLGADKPLPQHKGRHSDDLWFKSNKQHPDFWVEHKDVTSKKVGLNQVHATRYEVIVVDLSGNQYYNQDYVVLSPSFILKKILNKKGQHSHSAVECAQVNLKPDEVEKYGCKEEDLLDKIYEAYYNGEQNVKLKQFALEKAQAIVDRATQDMKDLEELLND